MVLFLFFHCFGGIILVFLFGCTSSFLGGGSASGSVLLIDSGVSIDCRVALPRPQLAFDGGFDRDETDELTEAPTTVATRLEGVLMDPAEQGFSFTTTMFLDVLCTLLLMVAFFLVGVSNPTSFIAFGTEIMPSEVATICAASRSFS